MDYSQNEGVVRRMKAVVISGGLDISKQRAMACLKDSDFIICADKGAEYAQMYGVTPDMIVGDMDSVDTAKLDRYEKKLISISPREKDFTDTHLAVIKALEAGADEIAVICATGLRSDHALANIRLLIYIYENNAAGKIIDEGKVNDENVVVLDVMCGESTYYEGHPRRFIKLKGLLSRTPEGEERRKIHAMVMELLYGIK